ncbi:MAG TPA: IS3 family transposase [Acholeplasma sp.]|nr:IS3 family transposase [Acholeplasma sp.]
MNFVKLFKHVYEIKRMCNVLKINRSTAYKIFNTQMSLREIDRLDLESRIIDLYQAFDGIYGAPKLQKELLKQGYYASVKRISRYMRRLGLKSIITKRFNPGSKSKAPDDKENLMNREFGTSMTNKKWVWISPISTQSIMGGHI